MNLAKHLSKYKEKNKHKNKGIIFLDKLAGMKAKQNFKNKTWGA